MKGARPAAPPPPSCHYISFYFMPARRLVPSAWPTGATKRRTKRGGGGGSAAHVMARKLPQADAAAATALTVRAVSLPAECRPGAAAAAAIVE